MKTWTIFATLSLCLASASAQAVELDVPNFSFEDPAADGPATNWVSNGAGGTASFVYGFTSASDGVQYHYLNLADLSGPNPSVTQSNPGLIGAAKVGTYTLTVAGGRRNNDATTDGSYVIELLAGGVVIGSTTVNDPFNTYAPDTWITF